MIRAGDLDRTIIIERVTKSTLPRGKVASTWAPLATMRAKASQISTSDALRNAGGITSAFTIFLTRWLDGITVADRVTYAGAALSIKSIREIGRREGLELTCEAAK